MTTRYGGVEMTTERAADASAAPRAMAGLVRPAAVHPLSAVVPS